MKLNKPSEKKILWHGTRTTKSKLIINSEEGFDMRFAANGRYGKGNYFAINS